MKDTQVLIKLSEDEKRSFRKAAELSGMGFSAWARLKLRLAAKDELMEAGEIVDFLTVKPNANGESEKKD